MKKLPEVGGKNYDFIDFALKNIGSYNVIFKHARWTWRFNMVSFRFIYLFFLWMGFVYFWYGSIGPQVFWGLFSLVPLLGSVVFFDISAIKVLNKYYPQYQGCKNWGLALLEIEEERVKNFLKALKLYGLKGIEKANEMVFREEQSESRISVFQVVFLGGFIPILAVFLNWVFEHKIGNLLDGFDLFLRTVFLVSILGLIAFAEEYMSKNNAGSKKIILQRTRHILNKLSLKVGSQ